MAKKATPPAATKATAPVAKTVTPAATVSTPVRNSPIPKVAAAAPAKKEFSHDQIAKRAFEISVSGTGGSEQDNWFRALRELNA